MRSPSSLRPTAALVAAAAVIAAALAAAAIGSCGDGIVYTDCDSPTLDEKGADGGPDPCHCDPPSSAGFDACGCLSNPSDQESIDQFQTCMALVRLEEDAGDGGGS